MYIYKKLSSKKKSIEKIEIIKINKLALFSIKIHKILVKQTIIIKIINKSLEIKKRGQPIHPKFIIKKKIIIKRTEVKKKIQLKPICPKQIMLEH